MKIVLINDVGSRREEISSAWSILGVVAACIGGEKMRLSSLIFQLELSRIVGEIVTFGVVTKCQFRGIGYVNITQI